MTRYGYARVSTREQNTDHQTDALVAAGVPPENLFVEKVSGKLASRPKLDTLLGLLVPGDEVVVTRLKRIGRSQQHLLDLVRRFGDGQVDFVVLEQGIDTSTPGGRLVFHFLAALAEYDREMIVDGTLDGLAAARARGRVGGRPAALSARQLDTAQQMYDTGQHTVDQIADTFRVGRSTLYRALHAHGDGRDCALIIYRNSRPKVDHTQRRYGETGAGEKFQLEADRKWFPIAPARRTRLRAMVYVVDGVVARVRAVTGEPSAWSDDDRGYADVPVDPPLTDLQIARQLPTLGIALGDPRPHQRGKIREYLTL
ncbi:MULTISPECIES: recombinase family protein [unclassified Pseudonocardia]|uniref:recombinase family protein n=1 Tax=unclassified Pseudonocardia TaxID=2619320 RepID=UPI0001FFDE62|nr:recombinase family protein [Pseudonocardia sp. Ae707_Ps1]OLM09212.1 putative resolvase, N-terminal [Pseudonocardia sp. Ae707_Ps1]